MKISIERLLPVQVQVLQLSNCSTPTNLAGFAALLPEAVQAAQKRFNDKPIAVDPVIQEVRRLFRETGIDPTRYRPSGEALIRRAIKGEPVNPIFPLVDINNICSMEFSLPFGCYDTSAIQGDIEIRIGKPNEAYQGVAKPINIAGKLCAADELGAFGSPISDSDRTKISADTKNVTVLVFGHITTSTDYMKRALKRFEQLAEEWLNATTIN